MKIFNYIYLFLTLVICTSFNSTAKAQTYESYSDYSGENWREVDFGNDLHTSAPSGSLSTCGVALDAYGQVIDNPDENSVIARWDYSKCAHNAEKERHKNRGGYIKMNPTPGPSEIQYENIGDDINQGNVDNIEDGRKTYDASSLKKRVRQYRKGLEKVSDSSSNDDSGSNRLSGSNDAATDNKEPLKDSSGDRNTSEDSKDTADEKAPVNTQGLDDSFATKEEFLKMDPRKQKDTINRTEELLYNYERQISEAKTDEERKKAIELYDSTKEAYRLYLSLYN